MAKNKYKETPEQRCARTMRAGYPTVLSLISYMERKPGIIRTHINIFDIHGVDRCAKRYLQSS